MNKMTTLLFSLMLLLTSCGDNNSNKQKQSISDRLLEDPEHHIKDSPDILKHDSTVLYTGWYYVVNTSNGYKRQLDKIDETYYIDPKPIVTAKNVTTFKIYESIYKDKKHWEMAILLDNEGTENWSYATRKAEVTGMKLAFILDNRLLQVSKVNSQITGGVTALTRDDYTKEELENFKTVIESEK